jgi:hypothetical protein
MTRVVQTDVVGGASVADKRVDFSYLRDGMVRSGMLQGAAGDIHLSWMLQGTSISCPDGPPI